MQPGSMKIPCRRSTHIFSNILEYFWIVHEYIMHGGRCINKGDGNVIPLGQTPIVIVHIGW
jgi:hypothetical protein